MFTATLEEMVSRMECETGIIINGEHLSNLRFVDDIIMFEENGEQLEKLLNDVNMTGKEDKIKINKGVTKILCKKVARRRRNGISIDGEQLEEVEECKYTRKIVNIRK